MFRVSFDRIDVRGCYSASRQREVLNRGPRCSPWCGLQKTQRATQCVAEYYSAATILRHSDFAKLGANFSTVLIAYREAFFERTSVGA